MGFARKDFKVESTGGNYMKLAKGTNRIRILTDMIDGFVYWVDPEGNVVPKGKKGPEGSKPVRVRSYKDAEAKNLGSQYDCKQFVAGVVWNYAENAMQVLEITQSTIIEALQGLDANPDWGEWSNYDIVIERTGDALTTEYVVTPIPPKPFTQNVEGLSNIKLEALYDGGDPFASENVSPEEAEAIMNS